MIADYLSESKKKTKIAADFSPDDAPARDLLSDLDGGEEVAEEGSMPQGIQSRVRDINSDSPAPSGVSRDIPLEKIQPSPYNPRKHFDEEALQTLADSIRKVGLLQAIIVRKIDVPHVQAHGTTYTHYFEIVGGERRYRACKIAGLDPVPSRIITMTDSEAREIAIIENLQREDLDPLEEAAAFAAIVQAGMTQTQLAGRLDCSQDRISKRMGLLRLPEAVQDLIRAKRLSPSHGERLLSWASQPEVCTAIAEAAATEGWSASRLDGRGGDEVQAIVERITGVQSLPGMADEESAVQTTIYDIPQVDEPLPAVAVSEEPAQPAVSSEPKLCNGACGDSECLAAQGAANLSEPEETETATAATAATAEALETSALASARESLTTTLSDAVARQAEPTISEGRAPSEPLPDAPEQTPEIVRTPAPVANPAPTLEGAPSGAAKEQTASTPAPSPAPVTNPGVAGQVATAITQEQDDWLFDEYLTLDQVLTTAMQAHLTPFGLNCLRAITDRWNSENAASDPISLTTRLDMLLSAEAQTEGFDIDTLRSNPHE